MVRGADVISCSWQLYSSSFAIHLAITFATSSIFARGGLGCVIVFSTGNQPDVNSVDVDPYATRRDVIAVGACDSESKVYTVTAPGQALWCMFPVGAPFGLEPMWLIDVAGVAGDNTTSGDAGSYRWETHCGTSQACAGVAGVAALVIAAGPTLTRAQVKKILADTCDPIREPNPAGGAPPFVHVSATRTDERGYGRVNAYRAVLRARNLCRHKKWWPVEVVDRPDLEVIIE